MSKLHKVTVTVGYFDGSQRNIAFSAELLHTRKELDTAGDESSGTSYALYRVKNGYRIFEKRWTNGKGHNRQNYAKLSKVFSEAELLEKYTLLANEAGIIETTDLDSEQQRKARTVLLAANASDTRLLPYTLANLEELIDLAHFLSARADVPAELQTEIRGVLEQLES